jgi:hypothetical protein
MPQPGKYAPRGEDWLVRKVQELEQKLQQVSAANPFGVMGIKPQAGGMVVEGYQTVNGPMTIKGSLDLPPASISDAALANPVQFRTASNGINDYAIDTTSTVRASVTLTVPDGGFSQALVIANATAMGTNSGTAADYLYVSAVVQAVNGGELYASAPAGLGAGLAAPFHTTLTGLTSGQIINVGVATRAGLAAWAAAPANQASIAATAIFLK